VIDFYEIIRACQRPPPRALMLREATARTDIMDSTDSLARTFDEMHCVV
jgi:hypothetical protein